MKILCRIVAILFWLTGAIFFAVFIFNPYLDDIGFYILIAAAIVGLSWWIASKVLDNQEKILENQNYLIKLNYETMLKNQETIINMLQQPNGAK